MSTLPVEDKFADADRPLKVRPAPDTSIVEEDRAVNHVDVIEDGNVGCILRNLPRALIPGPAIRIGADPSKLAAARVPLEDHAADVSPEAPILNPVQDDLGDRNLGIERLVPGLPVHRPRQAIHLPV